MRTCAGCGERAAQDSMQRLGVTPQGGLEWRRIGGRGSYLHSEGACAERFVASRKMVLGLRVRVSRAVREALLSTAPKSSRRG
ncbi:MAG: YlxR family protein [Deltaproteobacteria bacterium]|nr:YlxR family protein [Deltaproteobacteria bacterium]